jgi:hypothetical protein
LLIVVAGLSLMTGRGWLSGIISVILIFLLIGAVIMMIFGNLPGMDRMMRPVWENDGNTQQNNDVFQPKTNDIKIARDPAAKMADIRLKGGAGTYVLKGGSDDLVSGSFSSDFADLVTSADMQGKKEIATIETVGRGMMFGQQVNDLKLALTHEIPVDLSVETGAADLEFDLTRVVLENLNIHTGASSLKLALGDKAIDSKVNIKAGVSSVVIELPATVGARIILKSALTSKNLPEFEQVDEQTFKTVNYDLAGKKIELNLELGISNLEVKIK